MTKLMAVSSVAVAVGTAGLTGVDAQASTPAAHVSSTCLGRGVAKLPINARGVPKNASRTAHRLQNLARHCDRRHLVALANADRTRVSFGNQSPSEVFRLPQRTDRPYDGLVRVLSTRPAVEKAGKDVAYVWPRLATGDNSKRRSAWQEAVRAGLVTQKTADTALRTGEGYYGWRLFVNATGEWDSFVDGD